MQRWIIIMLCFCIAVSVTACSQRGSTKEPEIQQSQSIIESPSAPSEQGSRNESSASSEGGESSEQSDSAQGNIEDDDLAQPDPTLPENMQGTFIVWDHVEYKKFGDPSTFRSDNLELHNYTAEDAGRQAEILKASMLLPECCFYADSGIYYDGNFSNGTLRIGGRPDNYYTLGNGETIKSNGQHPFESFESHPLTGEKYTMRETTENVVGAYCETSRFIRYIGQGIAAVETHLLQYVIDLGDGNITYMFFFVSPKATAKDLKVYDFIANSIKLLG